MKFTCLCALLIVACVSVNAQKYEPFPAKGAVWKQYKEFLYDESEHIGWSITKQYEIARDTIIKGTTYRVLKYKERIAQFDKTGETGTAQYAEKYIGAIREDSNKRVYFYDFSIRKDTLLYDFNQREGLLKKTYLNNSNENQVIGIDSILLNGKYYRRLGIADKYGHTFEPYTYIIEGIGNINGLFTEITRQPEERTRLTCFSVNGETVFKLNDSADCSLVTSIIDRKKEKILFNIYPNPTNGNFTIQTQSNFPETYICVRDVLGRIMLQAKLQFENQAFDISNQPKGLYFVELRNGNRKSVQKIILK